MSSAEQIKVLVVHDDPLIRTGLIAALGSYTDIEPVNAEANRFESPLKTAGPELSCIDVIVANFSNGMDVAERLTGSSARCTPRKIMIVTASDREWEIRSAMECGIAGYLLAGCSLDHLAIGVRAVHRGARYFSPGVTQRLAESLSAEPLTGREETVLQLVVDGLCNKAIAARLGVALGTVKTHLKAIFDKLGVETRTQAVIAVARRGLLRGRVRTHAASAETESLKSATSTSQSIHTESRRAISADSSSRSSLRRVSTVEHAARVAM
jgi:two-component system NarL family response regulator